MRKFLFLFLPVLATACATGPSLESRTASYIGDSKAQLVQTLGVPDKQITAGGADYLAYDRHHLEFTPGFDAFGGFGNWYGGPYFGGPIFDAGIPPQLIEQDCETTFLLRNDKVASFTLRGNDCS
jgi:hypothetical protein